MLIVRITSMASVPMVQMSAITVQNIALSIAKQLLNQLKTSRNLTVQSGYSAPKSRMHKRLQATLVGAKSSSV